MQITRFDVKMLPEEKLKQRATTKFCVGCGHMPVYTMEM